MNSRKAPDINGSTVRSALYQALAELMAGPPVWMTDSAPEWPVYGEMTQAEPTSPAARRAILAMGEISAAAMEQRQAQYADLFQTAGEPCHWLYESAAKSGRILGPQTWEVAKFYRSAGLQSDLGAELPDHASLELAFLAHLAGQMETDSVHATDWQALELQFIQQHGDWLIQLGLNLAASRDEVYGPLGNFLAEWLQEILIPPEKGTDEVKARAAQPFSQRPDQCTLCGLCVQICPAHALSISENQNETALVLNAQVCTGCGHCQRGCESQVIRMRPSPAGAEARVGEITLVQSPRAACQVCGQPTLSRAEMDYLYARLGSPAWLSTCLDCRSKLSEVNQ